MRLAFTVLCGIATAGFLASGLIHVQAFFGRAVLEGGGGVPLLHVGIFIVGAPFVAIAIVSQLLNMRTTVGSHLFRALPKWMRYLGYGIGLYAMLIMAVFVFGFDEQNGAEISAELATRGFSAVWMVFYAGLAGANYSMSKVNSILRRCECRKVCPPSDAFCGHCGKKLRADA